MRCLRAIVVLLPVISLLTFLSGMRKARALPLFARKYSVPCTQCHLAFPRLNAFGMAFRQNGYRMKGAKGETPWETKDVPLAFVTHVGYTQTVTDTADSAGRRARVVHGAFDQLALELHSAGTIAHEVSERLDANFDGVGGPLTAGMAFVQFDDVVRDGRLNARAGIFDADIPYLADSRRTTIAGYLSPITLDGRGVELNGTQHGWTYALGVINSERTRGRPGEGSLQQLENPYVWVMRDLKGQLLTARVVLDRQDPRDSTRTASSHVQAELNAYLNRSRWALIPGLTYEHFADAGLTQRDRSLTALLEGLVLFGQGQKFAATARYELRHSPEFRVAGLTAFPEQDDVQLVGNVAWYVSPNARLVLELSHGQDNLGGPKVTVAGTSVHIGF